MNRTSIPWVVGPDGARGFSWNCVVGCRHFGPGCRHCWAARLAATRLAHRPEYAGLAYVDDSDESDIPFRWTGKQRFLPERLAEPLRKRKPAGIFVDDVSDLFGEGVTNEQIAAHYGVMAARPQHLFYVCTKRAKRRREWFEWLEAAAKKSAEIFPADTVDWRRGHLLRSTLVELCVAHFDTLHAPGWPLSNVIELTSVEDQKTADERIPDALATPSAVRGLSVEPLLEAARLDPAVLGCKGHLAETFGNPLINWVIVGGESGSRARPCRVEWIRSIVRQCADAGVPVFVKQMGANACLTCPNCHGSTEWAHCPLCLGRVPQLELRDRAGADPSEWPADLRVRQMPAVRP